MDASGGEPVHHRPGRGNQLKVPTAEARPGPPEGFKNRDAPSHHPAPSLGESSEMSHLIESGAEMSEESNCSPDTWKAGPALESFVGAGTSALNARAVEFIAKPGKVRELQECIRGQVVESLKRRAGFSGTIVLTSHKESRLVLVISFWTTKRAAEENHWEDSRIVRRTVYPLIDVCARVHTYAAAIPPTPKILVRIADLQVC
jgi:hypothetical protein